ncbi:MAG: tetratricopeptide repeat protein, partial [Gammaproteobacteria bacterium]|nr:tetratricopeptide repeat protein [Gammaproteobacteria bacterium]
LDDSDIRWLLEPLSKIDQKAMASETDFQADQWREEGPWLLLLLLPLCALAFRRGYLLLLLTLTLPIPQQSHALDWNKLWSRQDQQASRALDLGDHEVAADLFANSEWKAAAQYLAGQYQESLTTLQELDSPRANYNRGNSLARLGRLNEAITAYEKVLAQTPDDQDAKHNLELVKNLLEKQKSEQ